MSKLFLTDEERIKPTRPKGTKAKWLLSVKTTQGDKFYFKLTGDYLEVDKRRKHIFGSNPDYVECWLTQQSHAIL